MQTWYECKVKRLMIDQNGYERRVSNVYLLDAVSFTDAETRIYNEMQQLSTGEFKVVNIKQSQISEVINTTDGQWWYKAKINMLTVDEESGKEKKISNYILVMGDDIDEGLQNLNDGLAYMLIPYTVVSIQLSPIYDVLPYNLEDLAAKME